MGEDDQVVGVKVVVPGQDHRPLRDLQVMLATNSTWSPSTRRAPAAATWIPRPTAAPSGSAANSSTYRRTRVLKHPLDRAAQSSLTVTSGSSWPSSTNTPSSSSDTLPAATMHQRVEAEIGLQAWSPEQPAPAEPGPPGRRTRPRSPPPSPPADPRAVSRRRGRGCRRRAVAALRSREHQALLPHRRSAREILVPATSAANLLVAGESLVASRTTTSGDQPS